MHKAWMRVNFPDLIATLTGKNRAGEFSGQVVLFAAQAFLKIMYSLRYEEMGSLKIPLIPCRSCALAGVQDESDNSSTNVWKHFFYLE